MENKIVSLWHSEGHRTGKDLACEFLKEKGDRFAGTPSPNQWADMILVEGDRGGKGSQTTSFECSIS